MRLRRVRWQKDGCSAAADGIDHRRLEKIAADCGVSDKVQFLGWIDNKSDLLKETLARASVFASMSRFESFGISAAEAVASGCRVVLSDIPAHRQFAAFGAAFVPLEDGAALQSALQTAMGMQPAQAVDVRNAARRRQAEFGNQHRHGVEIHQ